EEGTQIVWEYVVGGYMRYDVDVIAPAVDGVMTQQLDGLASLLGRLDTPAPLPEVVVPEVEEAPVEEVDPEAVEEKPRSSVDEAFSDLSDN
ncbi:MAG: SRPBCC family protein, partial [Altererythrobacter ishigakiensis]|nr:SRPBCC family protein [Altererythrobacter ishigakiensis]